MEEYYEIETVEQLRAFADMLRVYILELLKEKPMTVTQLGELLQQAPAKIHYHVRELEKVGLLKLVETREKGGILEKYYQPVARSIGVQKSLFSASPDEFEQVVTNVLDQIQSGFLRAFRSIVEHKEDERFIGLGLLHIYATSDEHKLIGKQIEEILKQYETRRGIENEKELVVVFTSYPMAYSSSQKVESVSKSRQATVVGVLSYSRADLEKVLSEGKRLHINVVGVCHFADDISAELADQAIEQLRLVGKIEATDAVREVLLKKRV